MRCERFTVDGDAADTARALRELIPAPGSVSDTVAEIVAEVRAHGETALLDYIQRFDTGGAEPKPIRVHTDELEAAAAALDPQISHALERAIENLETVMVGWRAGLGESVQVGENRVVLRHAPVSRAAVYVPAGRAPYPSTVVMGVVPARLAGVEHIAVCAPPGSDGDVNPVVLAACHMTGASVVYRMGGAQAIAALAYGTASVAPVDVIVGPGSLFVQEAKRQVFGQVGIDGFAGPSDLLAIATGEADLEMLSLDLLAQAEHGAGSLVVAVSDAPELLDELAGRLEEAPDTGAVSALVHVIDPDQALAVAEAFAPEHLQLMGAGAEELADRVTKAGCLFVGVNVGTAFGDYIAGSNHILPTNGAARFASGLSPEHFLRRFTEVRIGDPDELARSAVPLARAEGFELHARSMEARVRDNGRRRQ
ncbi:MAG TPA: histidinol dehydrogenase [Solirubrobacteraceae bacterium]|nr:histidinol dehydrogenase [Solirubrobacteraceae bacterium]